MNNQNILVSLCQNMTDKLPLTVPVTTVVELIRSDQSAKETTERFRYNKSIGLDKEAQNEKKRARQFIPSAICEGGTDIANVKAHTGLGMGDFDDLPGHLMEEYMKRLNADPYTFLAHPTFSDTGIRVIYQTDATNLAQHPAVFTVGNNYFSALLDGHPYDKHCKNINRKSAICHAPNVIFHPEAKVFHVPTVEELAALPKEKPSAAPKKKMHYSAEIGEAGPMITSLLEAEGKTYAAGQHNEYISCAVYLMNKCGVNESEVAPWVAENFHDFDASETAAIVHSVYLNHADEHGTFSIHRENRSKYAKLEDIEAFISTQVSLRYNLILGCNEIHWLAGEKEQESFHEITDKEENTLWNRTMKAGLINAPTTFRSIIHSEFVPDFNPMEAYFRALPSWDGTTDYIRQVAARVTSTCPELFEVYFRKWFVAMVASMLHPEIVNHTILVFIGKQGIYKTSFFNHLLPPELVRYFSIKVSAERMDKDDRLTLSEAILICLEELDTQDHKEMNQLKAMVSIPDIKERRAYGRNKEHKSHLASFCGTGNNKNFMTDNSGSRRWLNFEVLSIVDPFTNPLPYEGLYAQALALFKDGFRYWFDKEEVDELEDHNHEFEAVNIEMELILEHYRLPRPGEKGIFVSTARIWEVIGVCIKFTLNARKITSAMHKLGFKDKRQNNARGFIVVELTETEKLDHLKDLPAPPELPF